MSFIQSRYKCKNCNLEFNVALGTFGYGMPQNCSECGFMEFEYVGAGWKTEPVVSKCCKAPLKIGGEGETHFYVCTKCNWATDMVKTSEPSKEEKTIEYEGEKYVVPPPPPNARLIGASTSHDNREVEDKICGNCDKIISEKEVCYVNVECLEWLTGGLPVMEKKYLCIPCHKKDIEKKHEEALERQKQWEEQAHQNKIEEAQRFLVQNGFEVTRKIHGEVETK